MKTKKTAFRRWLSFVLACMMLITMLQAGIFTVSANISGDYIYSVSASQATITDYTGSATNLVIPESLGGYPVVAIGNSAFYLCTSLTSVTIPRYVSSVGLQAFGMCSDLTQILVDPNNPYFISNSGVLLNYSQTAIYSYPGGKSGTYTVPAGVTSIGSYSFEGCSHLTGVTFDDALFQIGSYAFKNCTGLTSVLITAGVSTVSYAFQDCSSLTQIDVAPGNTTYKSVNGVLFDFSLQYLYEYPCGRAGAYTIPSGVKYIWTNSFIDCTHLTSVSIPSGVTIINNFAFLGCSGLTAINIPTGVTFIGNSAFYLCSGLTSVVIPGSVTTVDNRAFAYCFNLASAFFMGNAPGSFGDEVFLGCASGFTVYYFSANSGYSGSWHGYNTVAFEPVIMEAPTTPVHTSVTVTISYPGIATVREYKVGAGAWAPYTTPFTMTENGSVYARCSDSIGDNSPEVSFAVTNIDKIAPATPTLTADPNQPTDEIVNVTVNYPVDAQIRQVMIGHGGAWEDYTGPVQLKENEIVYARCFDAAGNESGTGSIVINFIGFYDFRYDVVGSETIITGYNGAGGAVVIPDTLGGCPVTIIARNAFRECNTITSITIPDTVYQIDHHAFYLCKGLTSVHLPAGLAMIDTYAFSGCSALTSVTFPAGLTDIGDSAFAGCKNLKWAYFKGLEPKSMGADVFALCQEEFIVYHIDKDGFESPWNGYITAMFEPEISAAPTTPTSGSVTVTIGYPAPAASSYYKIGGGSWTAYTAPLILTNNNTVYAKCLDAAGGTSREIELTVTNIDRDPPATPTLSSSPAYPTTGYVTVTAAFPSDASLKQYTLDSAGPVWMAYTGPIVLWANDIVYARCIDAAGNVSGTASLKVTNIIKIKEGIIEKRGSTTVINRETNLIYGLQPGVTKANFENNFISFVGHVRIVYTPDGSDILGTGTRVDVYNDSDVLIASYYIVIFGDVNGDGNIDSIDAGLLVDVENYMIKWDPETDAALYKAGDVNSDGNIDSIDAGIVVDVQNYMKTMNQVTGLAT